MDEGPRGAVDSGWSDGPHGGNADPSSSGGDA